MGVLLLLLRRRSRAAELPTRVQVLSLELYPNLGHWSALLSKSSTNWGFTNKKKTIKIWRLSGTSHAVSSKSCSVFDADESHHSLFFHLKENECRARVCGLRTKPEPFILLCWKLISVVSLVWSTEDVNPERCTNRK